MVFTRLAGAKDGMANCNIPLGQFDNLCTLFKGRIDVFSVVYVSVMLFSYLIIDVVGIYIWVTGFRLKQVEYFFYL